MSNKDISAVIIGMNILYEAEEQLKDPLKRLNLNINEWLVLKTLYLGYTSRPSEVAAYLNMQRASVTRHVDNLTELKMIDRQYQREDRRTVELVVTKFGEKVCKDILSMYPSITSNIYDRLDGTDKNLWLSMINKRRG